MQYAEMCFLIQYIDKIIFNIKRANSYDKIVDENIIKDLEEKKLKYKKMLGELTNGTYSTK